MSQTSAIEGRRSRFELPVRKGIELWLSFFRIYMPAVKGAGRAVLREVAARMCKRACDCRRAFEGIRAAGPNRQQARRREFGAAEAARAQPDGYRPGRTPTSRALTRSSRSIQGKPWRFACSRCHHLGKRDA
jgi:hypothetical protein